MSKAVKSVGRAVSKVVKGVTNAVKKVAKSKLGRVLIAAAAIYFGGAALMGAMGTSGAAAAGGLSGLSGAAANISAAWSSLGTAGSALMSGNLSGAGSAVASGFTGTAAGAGSALATSMGGAGGLSATAGGTTGLTAGAGGTGLTAGSAATGGVGSQLAAINTGVGAGAGAGAGAAAGGGSIAQGLIGAAKINAATQLVGGVVQGAGQQKALEDERAFAEQQRAAQEARYRASVDEFSRSANSQRDAARETENRYAPAVFDPVAEARAIGDRYRSEYDARNPTTGLVARGMQFQQPQTNNNFPIYNPYYFRG